MIARSTRRPSRLIILRRHRSASSGKLSKKRGDQSVSKAADAPYLHRNSHWIACLLLLLLTRVSVVPIVKFPFEGPLISFHVILAARYSPGSSSSSIGRWCRMFPTPLQSSRLASAAMSVTAFNAMRHPFSFSSHYRHNNISPRRQGGTRRGFLAFVTWNGMRNWCISGKGVFSCIWSILEPFSSSVVAHGWKLHCAIANSIHRELDLFLSCVRHQTCSIPALSITFLHTYIHTYILTD
jgi:hypothetical protein